MIANLTDYYTDRFHSSFFALTNITGEEAISMIQSGIVLFIKTNMIKPKTLPVVMIKNTQHLWL